MTSKLGTLSKHLAAQLHNMGLERLISPSYDLALLAAERCLFAHGKNVKALYLGRGAAAGEGVLGLSDLDLVAVCAAETTSEQIRDLKNRYNRLCDFVPLFTRDELVVYSTRELDEILSPGSPLHASLAQGKTAWKLIAGQDILKKYRAVEEDKKTILAIEQLKLWAAHFHTDLFGIKKRDGLSERYLWFKALAEFLKFHGFVQGDESVTRQNALELFSNNHPVYLKHKETWDSTIEMKKKTFVSGALPPARERHSLATDIILNAFEELEKKLGSGRTEPRAFEIELGLQDFEISKTALAAVKELSQTLKYWGAIRIELGTRTFVGLDDIVLLIELPGDFDIREMGHVNEYLSSIRAPQNIFAYVNHNRVVGTAVYPVDTDNCEAAVISRLTEPSVFCAGFDVESFWQRSAATGSAGRRINARFELRDPFASAWIESVVFERDAAKKRIAAKEPLGYDVIAFHRFFWKAIQMDIWLSRLEIGRFPLDIPITGPMILKAAEAAWEPHRGFLRDFYDCYKKNLNGEISDSIERYGPALELLEDILSKRIKSAVGK